MEAKLQQVLEVVAEGLDVQVEDVEGVVHEERHRHEQHPDHEAYLRQPPYPHAYSGHGGDGGHGGDAPDDDDLHGDVVGGDGVADDGEPGVELLGAQAQAGADAEQSGHDGDDVDEVAHPAKDAVADQRVEAGLHGHGEALAVGKERQEEAHQGVDDPAVDAPVVQGDVDGDLGQGVVREGRVGRVPGGKEFNTSKQKDNELVQNSVPKPVEVQKTEEKKNYLLTCSSRCSGKWAQPPRRRIAPLRFRRRTTS